MTRMTTSDRPRGVAVFDADAPPAIAFTRSLGRRGVPVTVYSPTPLSAAGASRYAAGHGRCPPQNQLEEFLPWLKEKLVAGDITCIAPTSDHVAFCLAELHDALPAALQRVLPPPECARNALFKDRFHRVLEELGFPSPVTVSPHSLAEARRASALLCYPVVIKPRAHVGAMLARGSVANTAEELVLAFLPWREDATSKWVFDRYPSLRLPMLQEYVPHALQHLYSVSGLVDPDGNVLAVSGSRKTAQWPPTLGIGTRFEPWLQEDAIELGAGLARRILTRGMFELEFIWDDQRREFLAIDLNPRAFGQISLDIARGNDLPWLWYRLFRREAVEAVEPPLEDVHWRHALPFHAEHLAQLALGPARAQVAGDYFRAWREPAVDVVLDRHDPFPGVVYTARMLRHPGGLIRPFLPHLGHQLEEPGGTRIATWKANRGSTP